MPTTCPYCDVILTQSEAAGTDCPSCKNSFVQTRQAAGGSRNVWLVLALVIFIATVFFPLFELFKYGAARTVSAWLGIDVPLWGLLVISGLGTALACAVATSSHYRLRVLLPGCLIGIGIFGATWLYLLPRTRVFMVELIVPFLIGAWPGYKLLTKWTLPLEYLVVESQTQDKELKSKEPK